MLTQLPPVPPARGLGGLGWLGGAVVSPGETEAGHRNGLGALPVAVKAIRIANPSLDPVLEKRRLPEDSLTPSQPGATGQPEAEPGGRAGLKRGLKVNRG